MGICSDNVKVIVRCLCSNSLRKDIQCSGEIGSKFDENIAKKCYVIALWQKGRVTSRR